MDPTADNPTGETISHNLLLLDFAASMPCLHPFSSSPQKTLEQLRVPASRFAREELADPGLSLDSLGLAALAPHIGDWTQPLRQAAPLRSRSGPVPVRGPGPYQVGRGPSWGNVPLSGTNWFGRMKD